MSEEMNTLEEAKKLKDELESLKEDTKKLLDENRRLANEIVLSGRASAGQEPAKEKEETALEYKNRIMRGELRGEEGRIN